jgi:hypothetical protein
MNDNMYGVLFLAYAGKPGHGRRFFQEVIRNG